MSKVEIDPAARAGRYSGRFAFYEEPRVLEQLEHVARASGTSEASIVRHALRIFLRDLGNPEAMVG